MINNKTPKQKIFFIGFNKTGTTSYHHAFKNIRRSTHDPHWTKKTFFHNKIQFYHYFNQFDVYTDGEMCNFQRLDQEFKNSLFILNTRSLYDWIYSRIKHIYKFGDMKKSNGNMANEWHKYIDKTEVIKLWIVRRNQYYQQIFSYFKNKTNLLIIDINSCDKKLQLINFTKIPNIGNIEIKNKRAEEKKIVLSFKQTIINTFNLLNINPKDYHNTGIIKNLFL